MNVSSFYSKKIPKFLFLSILNRKDNYERGGTMHIVQEHFQSIHQMLKTLDGRKNNAVMRGEDSSSSGNSSFTLTESWDHAMKLLRYGYTDILGEIKAGMKEHAKFQEVSKKRNIKTAVQGVAPHVPNALLGVPNAMIHYESTVQKTKAISLVYFETANAGVEADTFVKSGIALLSTVHALEIRGYRVKLKCMFFSSKCEDERAFASVNLKDYREQLDLHKLCFPIAHPSMFRRIGFKWLETVPGIEEEDWSGGYGQPIYEDELSEIEGILKENEYFVTLHAIREQNYNVDGIIEYLNLK